MSPEELDLAIEQLLEERPNEEKPKRRRRNKYKDLKKKVLRNEPIITDAMIYDLIGDEFETQVESMTVSYKKSEINIAVVDGWYDVINDIEDEFDVSRNNIRLEKIYDYYTVDGKDKRSWSGSSRLKLKVYEMTIDFCDKNDIVISQRGSDWKPCYVVDQPVEPGEYNYDKKAKDFVRMYFSSAPNIVSVSKYEMNQLKYDPLRLLEYDKKGKYKTYIKALREHKKTRFWSETYRVEKTKNNGSKQRLINELNSHGRAAQYLYGSIESYIKNSIANNDRDSYELLDEVVMDYEDSHYNVVHMYIW